MRLVTAVVASAVATLSLMNAARYGLDAWLFSRPQSAEVEVGPGHLPNLWWVTVLSTVLFAVAVVVVSLLLRRVPSASARAASVVLGMFVGVAVALLTSL